ncbi:MAG: SpoIIIAH-like family protein [Eubacterium sp.]|nr:SpoIIIAH-like family protein [Eubacterium sp.]MDE6155724.1 SpoIIIAH-like family protein [Eubacterium sp.]MDE6766597.1 SpoIIIAH-like family protein [Eubacterium sp.]
MSKNKMNKEEKNNKPVLTDNELEKKKSKKTKLAISCFVLLLAVGVMGNWYWENSDLSNKVSTISSAKEKILGEATYVDATTEPTTENQYFSSARVDRQSARDESLEKLQKVIDTAGESEDAKKEASEKISKISDIINIENKIETLVTAKGVNNCIAVINENSNQVDIIVDVEDLSDTVILQIKEIATSQLGCSYEDVTIIQSN